MGPRATPNPRPWRAPARASGLAALAGGPVGGWRAAALRAARVGAIFGVLGAALLANVPLCPFALVVREPCPGCGLGRATLAMLRGDFGAALHAHPLAPLVAPVLVGALAYNAVVYVARGRWGAAEEIRGSASSWIAGGLLAALLGLWVLRFFGLFGGPVPV